MITTNIMLNPRQCEAEIDMLADTYIELFVSGSQISDEDLFGLSIAIENLNYDASHVLNYKMSVIKRLYVDKTITENAVKKKEIKDKALSDIGRYMNGYMKESLY